MVNLSDYIILESNEHPNLLIAQDRLALTKPLRETAKTLGLTLENTAEQQDNHLYIGNITYHEATSLTQSLQIKGYAPFTPSILYFREFLKLLYDGLDNKGKRVYDGNKKQIRKPRIKSILNEITQVRNPWRGEFLDNKFEIREGQLATIYHKISKNGKLEQVTEQLDPDTLMEDKFPGINLESWINDPTSQGLPRKAVKQGSLWYWSPRDWAVVRFDACSDRVDFDCVGNPGGSDPAFGVRLILAEGESKKSSSSQERKTIPDEESALDERIKRAIDQGKPFDYKGQIYAPVNGVALS